jgi:hypothetical protein
MNSISFCAWLREIDMGTGMQDSGFLSGLLTMLLVGKGHADVREDIET